MSAVKFVCERGHEMIVTSAERPPRLFLAQVEQLRERYKADGCDHGKSAGEPCRARVKETRLV